jgi:hypothetical protein
VDPGAVTALGQAYLAVLNLSYVRPVANTLVEALVACDLEERMGRRSG